MLFSLGDFKFTTKTNINSMSRSLNSGISFQDRIGNHASAVAAKKWDEMLNLEGETLPAQGTGLKAIEPLFNMAKAQQAYTMTDGNNNYLGVFVIVSIKEGRESFASGGAFLKQSFSLELRCIEPAPNSHKTKKEAKK